MRCVVPAFDLDRRRLNCCVDSFSIKRSRWRPVQRLSVWLAGCPPTIHHAFAVANTQVRGRSVPRRRSAFSRRTSSVSVNSAATRRRRDDGALVMTAPWSSRNKVTSRSDVPVYPQSYNDLQNGNETADWCVEFGSTITITLTLSGVSGLCVISDTVLGSRDDQDKNKCRSGRWRL